MKINIVGCGLTGITAAVLLCNNHEINIFEIRNHIGGNCYDSYINNILVHNYGPHIFHTNDEEVFSVLKPYADWNSFKLQPKGNTELGIISLPYSKKTIKELNRELTQDEIVKYIFKDYSEKQWGIDFNKIPKEITNRIPKTINCEDPTWFEGEKYQCIPKQGYTKLFENMLNHKNINVKLGCNKTDWKKESCDLTIYTGKIDEYYNYCYGKLNYRTLYFKYIQSFTKLKAFMVNENTKNVKYTRSCDYSFLNENHMGSTIIVQEYSQACTDLDIPFYPIPFGESLNVYLQYKSLTNYEKNNIIFLGRLATYSYLDMWKAIKNTINKVKQII